MSSSQGSSVSKADLDQLLDEVRSTENSGDLKKARALIAAAPAALLEMSSVQYARGALAFRDGDEAEAIEAFEKAIDIDPMVAEYHSNLGAVLLERARRGGPGVELDAEAKQDLARAIEILTEAAGLSPKLPDVHNNLGLALSTSGQPEQALAAYDKALAIDAKDIHSLYNKAAALHALDREEECLRCLDTILELAPDFEPAKVSRENTLKRL